MEKIAYKLIIIGLLLYNGILINDFKDKHKQLTRANMEFDRLVDICINIKKETDYDKH